MGPGVAASLTLGLVGVVAAFVEPLLLWRVRARPAAVVVSAALLVQALACVLAALSPSPLLGVLALALLGPATGVACASAQAALAAGTTHKERATTLWNLSGAVGDLLGPAFLVGANLLGGSFRTVFLLAAVMNLGVALTAARVQDLPAPLEDDGDTDRHRTHLAAAWHNKRLLLACAAAAACVFLDEIVLAIGALFVNHRVPGALHAAVLGLFVAGALVGAVVITRLVATRTVTGLLRCSAVIALGALLMILVVTNAHLLGALFFILGLFSSWQHPLAMALVFNAEPADSRLAAAVSAWFSPLEAAAPFLVALVAETLGVVAAMALLALQPIIIGMVAWRLAPRGTPPPER